jgi:Zn-dependent peptidase ImmA (M78 family)
LGDKPVRNLKDILGEIGIRVFELAVPQNQFSGFSYWHSDYGPCILVNAKDAPGRRAFTLAHEYAHILHSDEPSVCDIGEEGRPGPTKEERRADVFAIDFLLPAEPVRQDFARRGLSRQPSVQELGAMAGRWCVSVQAMAYRHEDLALIDEGHACRVLAAYEKPSGGFRPSKVPSWERRLGRSFVSQAMEAYHAGHISIGKLAHCLGLPIRKALEAAEQTRGAQ